MNSALNTFLLTVMIGSTSLWPAFSLKKFQERLGLGSFILAPYVLTIVWQYFSTIGNKPLAWTGAAIVSAGIWYLSVAFKEGPSEKLPWQFWLIVALPLLIIYSLRLAFPDTSFDVLNYHIFHSERALQGSLFISGDFFPTAAPFNPTPDILTGLYRYVLGYRLGTIVNFVALIWTGIICQRWLRDYVASVWFRSFGVLFILCTEQLLFQINNYMVDLLALPLLLEATIIAVNSSKSNKVMRRTVWLALLLGVATAFKLANLFFAVPIVLVYVFNLIVPSDRHERKSQIVRLLKGTPAAALAFVAPLLPFTLFIFRLTGNPIFPLYNGLFKSPYWPQGAVFDPRWGPWGVYETIAWPVVMFFRPWRLNEFTFYSGRLTVGYILAAVCLLIARGDRRVRAIAFITLLGTILWSASSGYIRYALYLELTSGFLLVWLATYIWTKCARLPNWGKYVAQAPLWLLLIVQTYVALGYVNRWEWSTRETGLRYSKSFTHESRNLFRDRSLATYLAPEDKALFADVEVWFDTTYKTSAFEALLKPNIPVIGVRMPNYFDTNQARQKFVDVLQSVQGKRMFTLTDRESLEEARAELAARGLTLGKARACSINYFSDSLKFNMLLVEVLPSWQNSSGQTKAAEKGLPLPDMAFKARLSVADTLTVLRAGQQQTIRVMLTNESSVTWPGRQPSWQFQLTVGNRWLDENGGKINDVDGRVALFEDLQPSETVELPLTVTAPKSPGIYILQLDAIQEGVAWFGDRGSKVLSLRVKVE
jgi:hypothetical protein